MTKAVYSSNHCDIGLVVDERNNRLVVMSAIDNLVKGASGQAIQNPESHVWSSRNLWFGGSGYCPNSDFGQLIGLDNLEDKQ